MESKESVQFAVFSVQKLGIASVFCTRHSALHTPIEISNLKSQIRAAQGGRQ
jgi:hypothetical protein